MDYYLRDVRKQSKLFQAQYWLQDTPLHDHIPSKVEG